MSRRFAFLFCLVTLMVLSLSTPGTVSAANCNVVQIATSVWTGQLQCGNPEDITVKIVVTISGACSTTSTFYRCGSSTESWQFSACGKTHTVSLASGTWEDALSDCSGIAYSAQ